MAAEGLTMNIVLNERYCIRPLAFHKKISVYRPRLFIFAKSKPPTCYGFPASQSGWSRQVYHTRSLQPESSCGKSPRRSLRSASQCVFRYHPCYSTPPHLVKVRQGAIMKARFSLAEISAPLQTGLHTRFAYPLALSGTRNTLSRMDLLAPHVGRSAPDLARVPGAIGVVPV